MFVAVTGNRGAWVGGWGGQSFGLKSVTSVWLSVQCLQETNLFKLLHYGEGGGMGGLLTVTHSCVDMGGGTRGKWEIGHRHLLHPSKASLRARGQQAVSMLIIYSPKRTPKKREENKTHQCLQSLVSGIHNRLKKYII